jgi:succinoglycan biosynthesis transport protein ExoP
VQTDHSYADDEIDVTRYLFLLWRHRLVVVAGVLLSGFVAVAASVWAARTYEATARLVVAAPKTGAASETTPAVSVATFRALLENQTVAERIVEEFGLNKPPHNLSSGRFISRAVTIEVIRDSSVIVVKVRLRDSDLAARVANRLAEAAVDLALQLSQQEAVSARDIIKTQLDGSKQRLDSAEENLETFKRQAQIELLRKDVDAVLGQRGTLLALLVEIQTEKARLAQAEALLAQRDRINTLMRSIDTDPAAMETARMSLGEPASVLPLQLRNEVVDPVYESLDQVIATSRTKLAGLEKEKSELIDVRRLDADQQAKLTLLYQRETELSRLQTEYDLSRGVYVDVATRYEQARLQVAARSAQLQLMDAALPPDRPVSRHVARNTSIAVVLGFSFMLIAVVLAVTASHSSTPTRTFPPAARPPA